MVICGLAAPLVEALALARVCFDSIALFLVMVSFVWRLLGSQAFSQPPLDSEYAKLGWMYESRMPI